MCFQLFLDLREARYLLLLFYLILRLERQCVHAFKTLVNVKELGDFVFEDAQEDVHALADARQLHG